MKNFVSNKKTIIFLVVTYILNLFDLLMTNRLVYLYGIGIEGNPLGVWMFANDVAWIVKIFIVGILLAAIGICIRKKPKYAYVAYVPLVAYSILAMYHIIIFICT